jgi:hypothetical protein
MKTSRRHAVRTALFVSVLASSACFASDVLVTVRPDGSGTITHTGKRFKSARAALTAQFRRHAHEAPDAVALERDDTISEAHVREYAARFGKGIQLVSTRVLAGDDIDGRTSVYAFERIQDVMVDLTPSLPGGQDSFFSFDGMVPAPDSTPTTHLTFDLETREDGTRLLTVRFPDFRLDPSAGPPYMEKPQANSPEELAFLRAILRNARVDLRLRTATPLQRTNSPYRDGNEVLLLSLDVERIALGDEINKVQMLRPGSFDEIRWALHDLPGVKIAIDRDITLEFIGPPAEAQTAAAPAQAAPPDSEIFLLSLAADGDGLKLGTPMNISNSPGYDNQPSFTPDGRALLFTSARGAALENAASGRPPATDIYRFDLVTNTVRQLTATAEGEYSPTVTPDGRHMSVIRVEADGTQRLWRFTLDGRQPALVLNDVKPVGYHAWIDDRRLALFILGEPATLQVADRTSGKTDVVAKGIGRSLQRIPKGGISFVQIERGPGEAAPRTLTVMELDLATRATRPLVPAVAGAAEADLAWMPDGALLMAYDSKLYLWRRGRTTWTVAADLAPLGLYGVTRIAVNPDGDRVAIVAQPRQP